MNKNKLLPVLSCFLVTVIFSIHFVVAKQVLQDHHPLALTSLRGIIGGILVLGIFYKKIEWPLLSQFKLKLFFIGALGFFGNQLLFMSGLKMTTALNASIITNAVPLVTASLAVFMGLESSGFKKFGGILLGFLSVLYIMFQSQSVEGINWLGDLLVFSNMFVFAIAIVFIKQLTSAGVHYAVVSGFMMVIGGVLSSFIAGADTYELLYWSISTQSSLLMMVFEVIVSTIIAYLLNFYALKHLVPSKITIFIYLQPFITALTSFYLTGELPAVASWVAFVGILVGGLLVLQSREKVSLT